jgi:hypothetical protein
MIASFSHSIQSEWLKKRHTASSWIIWICAFFMPLFVLIVRLISYKSAYKEVVSKHFWNMMHYRNWVAMGMFLLPLTLILATSLIASIEYKNNTWKQLHATPQSFPAIFFSKLVVIIIMVLQLFALFNIGIYLSAIMPSIIFKGVPFPSEEFPLMDYITSGTYFFIDCLPVLALQYLLSLKFRNFLVSIGIGFALLIVSLLALNWKYGYIVPYIYLPLSFEENQNYVDQSVNRHWWAFAYFIVITTMNYLLYIFKKEKS